MRRFLCEVQAAVATAAATGAHISPSRMTRPDAMIKSTVLNVSHFMLMSSSNWLYTVFNGLIVASNFELAPVATLIMSQAGYSRLQYTRHMSIACSIKSHGVSAENSLLIAAIAAAAALLVRGEALAAANVHSMFHVTLRAGGSLQDTY